MGGPMSNALVTSGGRPVSGGVWLTLLLSSLTMIAAGCASHSSPDPGAPPLSPDVVDSGKGPEATASAEPYLLLNQRFVEGLRVEEFDLHNADAVFWHVFSRLPNEVVVYPSENYYYFILNVQGRQIWGNIRIPAGKRDEGFLSFGYFEYVEFPQLKGPKTGMSNSKFFGPEDGLELIEEAPLRWRAAYRGKQVAFNLHPLEQEPPRQFELASNEKFIQRTFDESGYEFFLLFNTEQIADHQSR